MTIDFRKENLYFNIYKLILYIQHEIRYPTYIRLCLTVSCQFVACIVYPNNK